MESDERTREERSNPWRNKPLERPPSDEVPIHHDESGDAVRRATENGNGALVGPYNSAE